MSKAPSPSEFDPDLIALVRLKSRRLKQGAPRGDDLEDFEHDCIAEILRKLPAYRSERGSRLAFVTKVLANFVANRRRERVARKRRPGRMRPLEDSRHSDSSYRGRNRSEQDYADLEMDLAEFLAALPEELRTLANWLMHGSLADAARHTGIARTTLQSRLQRLRTAFLKEFPDYC